MFDLYCSHPVSEEDLENLVDLLISVRTGLTHGDPQDIKHFRKDETNNLFSLKNATCSNINELPKIFANSEPYQFHRYFLSIFCKQEDSNIQNIDYVLQNLELKNDEELMFTMIEDNSFDNVKIIVLCS